MPKANKRKPAPRGDETPELDNQEQVNAAPEQTEAQPEPKAEETQTTGRTKKSRKELYAVGTLSPDAVITLGSRNKPKVKDSMAEAKFALYGDLSNGGSITVREVQAKCGENGATYVNKDGKVVKLKPSIRWDWAHKLIQIDGQEYVAPVA